MNGHHEKDSQTVDVHPLAATDAIQRHATHEAASLLDVIAKAVSDPRMDVEKMERLLAMQERVMDQQRRQEYADALNRLQSRMPQINKHGQILDNSGKIRNTYAKYEDIDILVRPMLSEEGFSLTFNEEEATDKGRRYSCKLLHRAGHSETKYITLPLDSSGSKNGIQGAGSTFSYARRYLLKAHLNLVERDEDTDGNSLDPISDSQAKDLEALISETKANKAKFLEFVGVDAIEKILARDYPRALAMLEEKRRRQQ